MGASISARTILAAHAMGAGRAIYDLAAMAVVPNKENSPGGFMQSTSIAIPRVAFALLTLSLSAIPIESGAEPIVRAGITSYYVGGVTVDDIRKDILDKAPPNPEGNRRAAFTKWDVQWRWKLDKQEGQCSVVRVASVVGVSMFVPKLRSEEAAPKKLLERWKRYEKALRDHEDGHKDIAVRAGTEIEAAVLGLKAESTCEAVEARAEEVAKGVLENFRKEDDTYSVKADDIRF